MKLNIAWLATMLGLLFVANALMVLGYVNTLSTTEDEFLENFMNPAPSLNTGEYEAIGTYDNLTKKPAHGKSDWRGTAPDEPLVGPPVVIDEDSLFIFANNQCKPECCGASFSCSSGCVCTTPEQRNLISQRGGNNTA